MLVSTQKTVIYAIFLLSLFHVLRLKSDGRFTSTTCSLEQHEIVLVKIGGSSITNKNKRETLDSENIDWFAGIIGSELSPTFQAPSLDENTELSEYGALRLVSFVIVHGAGSFGHHQAKEFGLKGQHSDPSTEHVLDDRQRRHVMQGLSATRQSVLKLNQHVVASLYKRGANAVGISPCISSQMEAHGGGEQSRHSLIKTVEASLAAGLVPVIHGDACLYGNGAGILSGDTIVDIISESSWVSRVLFLTDVDGVYSSDPKTNPEAELFPLLPIDIETGEIALEEVIVASSSSYAADATGGLKTKLSAAISVVVKRGINVTIARSKSESAEKALRGEEDGMSSTLFPVRSI